MRFSLAVLAVVGGCDMYWNSGPGGEDDICVPTHVAPQELRDTFTGACEEVSGCSGCGCEEGGGAARELPACSGPCTGLGENTCTATAGCHAVYDADKTGQHYVACWEPMPFDEHHDGVCSGLDDWSCAAQDNCASVMGPDAGNQTRFDHCIAESGGLCIVDVDCGDTQRCDTSVCHQAPCTSCPTCGACAPTCYGVCVPKAACSTLTTEAACTARADCAATYTGYDCTCVGTVCTCKNEVFASCEPR